MKNLIYRTEVERDRLVDWSLQKLKGKSLNAISWFRDQLL